MHKELETSAALRDVKYEIRGQLANRAYELEKRGYEVISLNIGNPGLFGFRTPETMRLAMIENLSQAEPYSHQKGIFPAREAVVMQQQDRGIHGISVEEVFIGNGVSELIDLSLRALLNPGDEVLVPSPDYPLWSAAVSLNGGTPRYYDCDPQRGFQPDTAQLESLVGERTKAIVVINPNNPSGAVYGLAVLQRLVAIAETHGIVLLADEIYDQMVYDDAEFIPMATLVDDAICLTFSGLSKVYRACGYRVGWCVFSGDLERAAEYVHGMELLAALRLCSNVPGQWAVQTALGGFQSIRELVRPGGRLHQQRDVVIERVSASPYLSLQRPMGAMYAFIKLDDRFAGKLDDREFAQELLEEQHVLVAPGSSFNTPYSDHFRITTLPDSETINLVFDKIDSLLQQRT
ncbi:MAG: aminotransferase class I/II-fold pyridoxal phosphate-dependent enzyme [Gammaproteobacteria bacterium]|nr:aminotransferase class I/II-fold pyridoxal phosphate-dependent enzyme [Gammaproteobacteria bacterium]MDH3373809.1 aminotransferase class I/II-fold pyridoxal phosphate-dependent enzyme [Gammaproteobacteria bacterium]MDH3408484.1 aminotransferase class I/II-fold pyridoxal phosphate-dependent enzyme [Gammaproteobacteria bacterium]MDH3551365.1 aminotransferase class I/II-fold pyridoxal phosphate-dependent enzyme [Gammaproteobacteria bacterium]